MSVSKVERPDIRLAAVRDALPERSAPYYQLISYGRHIGYRKDQGQGWWYARIRTRAEGYYRRQLGRAIGPDAITYDEALGRARAWFQSSGIRPWAASAKPVGVREELVICPVPGEYSVAHALHEYVEWKRIAAAKSHFQTNLSIINYHIVPRLANVRLNDFNSDHLRTFVREVLETAPKRGNQTAGLSRPIASLSEDQLRKRKKTVNALISILRLSFQLAWERGGMTTDRPIRCLRQLPVVNRPRTLHLSRSECRQLMEQCKPDLRRLVLGALYTGCRATELVRLRKEDVGRDGYGIYIHPLKTYRPRFVFLPDEGMAWFLKLVEGIKPKDLVFVRDDGKPWFDYKHPFKAAVREAGLPDDFTFHGLRHTYASQLIQAGATVYAVADQLGHADATTVLKTYGHLSPQIRESEVRQRFTTISDENVRLAAERGGDLAKWRDSLHGGNWREYAKITDVPRRETEEAIMASLRPRRLLALGRARD